MNTTTRSSTAERFGHKLGRTSRAYRHCERRVVAWLISVGAPSAVATALVWVVKLAVLGILLYAAFWLALLLLFAVAAAWMAGHDDATEEKMGVFTTQEDLRETPGYDPVPYNDADHPDFPDEKDL
ncbi:MULTISPECIES: DUF3742 family protein [Pseudomonadota]|uniref:Transposon n=1 Tax=Bordetella petrii (strain ATCC BAA-461 / DSM 12804 / CCUG 43448 / CIP 107267 / Se-1111R) TaxID=340100 RepID=A9IEA3_BORPD|nr:MULTISPECIES: DUF3742 family protein [Pseudomonadota]CAP41714.1 hypothetical protein Bpet1379 [Bordetella petrii]HCK4605771.1 DUF3742 family protein [Pseudomonas aeruginosa]